MKTLCVVGILLLALCIPVCAIEVQPPTIQSLNAEVEDLTIQLQEAQETIRTLEDRLRVVEDRLGDSYGSVSAFNTIERRLEELERDTRR